MENCVATKTQMRQKRQIPKTLHVRGNAAHKQLYSQPPKKPRTDILGNGRTRSPPTSRLRRIIARRGWTKNGCLQRNSLEACTERKKEDRSGPQ